MYRLFSLFNNDLHGRPLTGLTGQVGALTTMVHLGYVSLYIDLIMTNVELITIHLVYLTLFKGQKKATASCHTPNRVYTK